MGIMQQQIETFNRNGWLVVENLLLPEEVAALNQRAEEIILGEQFPDVSASCVQIEPDVQEQVEAGEICRMDAVRTLRGAAKYDDLFQAHMRNPKILDVAEGLVGPDICFFGDLLFNKPPMHGSEKPWHQDNASLGIEPALSLVGCWVALNDADVENGCMRFIPGSHTWGLLEHEPDPFGSHVELPALMEVFGKHGLIEPAACVVMLPPMRSFGRSFASWRLPSRCEWETACSTAASFCTTPHRTARAAVAAAWCRGTSTPIAGTRGTPTGNPIGRSCTGARHPKDPSPRETRAEARTSGYYGLKSSLKSPLERRLYIDLLR